MPGNLITIIDADGEMATVTGGKLDVNATVSGSGDGAIQDGANATIEATVFDFTNSNPLAVVLRDTNGDYVSVGGGTQYTEDAPAAADPVGTAVNLIRADALAAITTLDGDNVAARGTNKGELYVKHVDAIPITDNGGSLTVDAASLPLPTGASTLVEQQTQTTALQLIDDTVKVLGTDTYLEGTTKALVAGGVRRDADTTAVSLDNEAAPLLVDARGLLKVEAFSGETLPVNGTVTANLAAGTNNIGDVDVLTIAAGDNNIGNVDIVTVPAPLSTTGGGTEAAALRVTLASDSTGLVSVDDNGGSLTVDNAGTFATQPAGSVADDAVSPPNPVMTGGQAVSPDGTDPTAVAENDVVRFRTDLNRRLYVATNHPRTWHYHLNTSTAQTDTSVQAAPGAGLRLVITNVQFTSGAATAINMFLEEGTTTIAWGPIYLEAVAGRGYVSGPIFKPITANTALSLTTSASIAQAVEILGFIEAI